MSMNTPVCRAKDPSKCRYHGNRGRVTTNQLRQNMLDAYTNYNEAQKAGSTENAYRTYQELKQSRTAYYATDEGDHAISVKLASPGTDEKTRKELTELQSAARAYRYEQEVRDGGSDFAPKSEKRVPYFAGDMTRPFVNGVKTIATITDGEGTTAYYRYKEDGLVYVDYVFAEGDADIDHSRVFGRTLDSDKARYLLYEHFRRNWG